MHATCLIRPYKLHTQKEKEDISVNFDVTDQLRI
jgi:hypothetical protein